MATDSQISDRSKEFKPGNKVHYIPSHFSDSRITKYNTEKGIVKSVTEAGVFVVYKCGGDWDNYKNYTAALTNPKDLNHGWL